MSDALGFLLDTKPDVADLSAPRGRLLYLRDVVVPGIPLKALDMNTIDCGTHACLAGWAERDSSLRAQGIEREIWQTFFGISSNQTCHMFAPNAYSAFAGGKIRTVPTHAELTQHINDVLEGRVK